MNDVKNNYRNCSQPRRGNEIRKCDMKRVDKSKIVKSSRGIVDCVTYTVRSYVNDGKMKRGNSVH